MTDDAPLPDRITVLLHRECGAVIGDDGWCWRCETTPDLDECDRAAYVHEDRVSAPATRTARPPRDGSRSTPPRSAR